MENNTTIVAAIAIVFFVLALVAIFRFDKVKNTFEGLGFKINIAGSKEKKTKRSTSKDGDKAGQGGKATIKVGRDVKNSKLRAKSSHESGVDVKQDVEDSDIDVQGG